ncbi:MAG TPA: hypothetical protein VN772_01795 [Solirubrobacteraceae bacterium]|nr:hypothetical protein [Solirubrobacteraceae bacterium]
MSLVPVPSEQPSPTCANCGAALVSDQRYCLACGQPCSPTRLAFLDVLQTEQRGEAGRQLLAPDTLDMSALGYGPQAGAAGWLRRYSGLLGLLSVLLMCLIVGLLVGHWVTQGKSATGPQVVEIKGLSGLPAAAASPTATTPASGASSSSSAASAKEEAEESKEAAKETKAEKAPPPAPVKVTPAKINKLTHSTGKQHQEEVNALGAQPIETG